MWRLIIQAVTGVKAPLFEEKILQQWTGDWKQTADTGEKLWVTGLDSILLLDQETPVQWMALSANLRMCHDKARVSNRKCCVFFFLSRLFIVRLQAPE